jgi:hypothetical protein
MVGGSGGGTASAATTTAVEAHSLSSITTLAANPPKYPRNPTEEPRSSLVLYIARVPGRKGRFWAETFMFSVFFIYLFLSLFLLPLLFS